MLTVGLGGIPKRVPQVWFVDPGQLGDCWFLSAVAVLIEVSRISEVIITPEYIEEGIYTVCFCIQAPGKPAFATSRKKNELWVSILEKAYAKLHGSYEALEGGLVQDALVDVIGGAGEEIDMRSTEAQIEWYCNTLIRPDDAVRQNFMALNQRKLFISSFFVDELLDKIEFAKAFPGPGAKYDEFANPGRLDLELHLVTGPKPFRFINAWANHVTFLPLISKFWEENPNYGGMFGLHQKLKKLKNILKSWNKETFGNIFSKLTQAKDKSIEAEKEFLTNPSPSNRQALSLAQVELQNASLNEISFWKQKSHLNWLELGDRNSKFYQSYVKGRRKKLRIGRVRRGEGSWTEDMEEIQKAAVEHYSKLFTASQKVEGGNMIIKLDLSKAFDRMSWDYLENLLGAFGFNEYNQKLLLANLKATSFSVLINDHEGSTSLRPTNGPLKIQMENPERNPATPDVVQYIPKPKEKWDDRDCKKHNMDNVAKAAIFKTLDPITFSKIKHLKTAMEIWKGLGKLCEGSEDLRKQKIENIRLLRSLPTEWYTKATAMEEGRNLENYTIQGLLDELRTYEHELKKKKEEQVTPFPTALMTTSRVPPSEGTCTRNNDTPSSSQPSSSKMENYDEEFAMMVKQFRKFKKFFKKADSLKRPSKGKPQVSDSPPESNLCYNCRKPGHWKSACPYPKVEKYGERERNEKKKKAMVAAESDESSSSSSDEEALVCMERRAEKSNHEDRWTMSEDDTICIMAKDDADQEVTSQTSCSSSYESIPTSENLFDKFKKMMKDFGEINLKHSSLTEENKLLSDENFKLTEGRKSQLNEITQLKAENESLSEKVKSLNQELGILKSKEAVDKLLEATKQKGREGLGFDPSSSKRKGRTTFIPPKPTAKPNKQKGKEKEKPTEVPTKVADEDNKEEVLNVTLPAAYEMRLPLGEPLLVVAFSVDDAVQQEHGAYPLVEEQCLEDTELRAFSWKIIQARPFVTCLARSLLPEMSANLLPIDLRIRPLSTTSLTKMGIAKRRRVENTNVPPLDFFDGLDTIVHCPLPDATTRTFGGSSSSVQPGTYTASSGCVDPSIFQSILEEMRKLNTRMDSLETDFASHAKQFKRMNERLESNTKQLLGLEMMLGKKFAPTAPSSRVSHQLGSSGPGGACLPACPCSRSFSDPEYLKVGGGRLTGGRQSVTL
ncbi:unnamed protein product [Cuscuta campestris]|uniref:CCHC-type domain-containing protein n=1 Tax=Cuscuta campestris TaxID=132261 RepID=A0A484KGH0_9ASTE|nr:unnamed protein product [Cuscuta campestris]